MRNQYYSHKARHIVKFSSLFITALLDCAVSMADESSDKTKVVIPLADSTTFVYNGNLQTYSLSGDTTLFSIFGNTHTNAGKYEVTVSLNNPLLCEWEDGSTDSKTYNFTINKSRVEIPSADTSKFVFNGQQQTYGIAESEYYTADGINKTNAGDYEVTVSLNDSVNYEWTDSTVADKKFNFAISKAMVEIPSADTTKFTYNGAILVYAITPNINYEVTGNAQANAGSHIVTVSLSDNNHVWADGTTEAKTFNFEISKSPVELPVAVKDTFYYDGKVKFFEVAENNRYTVDITNEMASAVGIYERTVSINDTENYMWTDNTSEPKKVIFVIEEGKVKIPERKDFTYTGATISFVPENEGYTVENREAINAGEYNVKLTLNPSYVWEDGSKDTINLSVKILPILVDKPAVISNEVTYDSTIYTIKVPENPAYTISGRAIGIEPGTYTTTVSLKPNYAWSDSTTDNQIYQLRIVRIRVAIPSADSTIFYYNRKVQTYTIDENDNYIVKGNKQTAIGTYDVAVTLIDTFHYEWTDSTAETKHYQFDIVESEKFDFDTDSAEAKIIPGEELTIDINVDGIVQYYKLSCDQMPELADTLYEFDNESHTIKIPTSSSTVPGKYKMDVTLVSGNLDSTFTVDVTIDYPASCIIVLWNDVIAVDKSKVKTTTYQWYKDGELIPGATGQYYSDKAGLCGYYKCEVDGGLSVGPTYLDFGRPLNLSAQGETGKIIANVAGSTTANVLLMSVGGMVIDSKPAAKEMTFTVKPGIYVLVLDGTDQSVKVIVK
ncbi:MAG: hypothetical protein UH850_16770 [Paludibacteraceae bacterium]|nr:hypothetical protein [Paludibacteraceae bacterium]